MRVLLLAGTALTGIGLMSAQAAAQSPAMSTTGGPLRLGLGGYFQFYGVAFSGSSAGQAFGTPGSLGAPEAHKQNFDIKTEGEVWFTGETKFDNGLIVGAQVELEASTSADQIDERYVWFAGDWGRVLAGATNAAPYKLAVGAPAIDSNFDGQDPNYRLFRGGTSATTSGITGHPRLTGAAAPQTIELRTVTISGDSEKITYLSPRAYNFRVGVSYTPTNTEEASSGNNAAKLGTFAASPPNNCNPANFTAAGVGGVVGNPCTFPVWNNLVGVGINHEGTYGPVRLQAYGGYEHGTLASVPTPVAVGLFGDRNAWGTGFDLGLYGFHAGFDYLFDDNGSNLEKQQTWAVGLTYTAGPLTVGGSYMDSRAHRGGDPLTGGTGTTALGASTGGAVATGLTTAGGLAPLSAERLNRVLIGARYDLAPGIDLRAAYHYYQVRDCTVCKLAVDGGTGAHTDYLNAVTFGTNIRF